MRFSRAGMSLLIGLMLFVSALVARPAVTSAQIDPWTCEAVTGAPAASPDSAAGASPAAVEVISFPEDAGTVTIFAAASLTDAFTEVETALEVANPQLDIVNNFAGSQSL